MSATQAVTQLAHRTGRRMEQSDDELLAQIAAGQDREAFAELYRRMESKAFHLARYLCASEAEAQDAVQEAMLRVWQSAKTYQPGNARGWILRIVARECMHQARRQRRERVRIEQAEHRPLAEPLPEPADERAEVLQVLRRLLGELPATDRRIVALYFGASITQKEIAQELSVSQRTVSFRVEHVLKSLRAQLTQAGFAAAAPLVGAEAFKQALTSGETVPAGLRGRVLEGLTQAAQESLRASRRVVAAKTWGQGVFLPAGLVLATAGACTLWWAAGSKPSSPQTPGQTPAEPLKVTPLSSAQTPERTEPLVRRWNFNTREQALDFTVAKGSWHFVPDGGRDGSGCMETSDDMFCAYLNIPDLKPPLLLQVFEFPLLPVPANGWMVATGWEYYTSASYIRNIGIKKYWREGHFTWIASKNFMGPDFTDRWVDDQRTGFECSSPAKDSRFGLFVYGRHRLDDLELRAIPASEIPDVSAYLAAVQKIKPANRVGKVTVPELKSCRPPEPVYIEFCPDRVRPADAKRP